MSLFYKFIQNVDLKLLKFFNQTIKCTILDKFFPLFTNLGGAFSTIFISLALLTVKGNLRFTGLLCFISLTTGHIFIYYSKKFFVRKRPFHIHQHVHTFKHKLKDYSFPSGHTTASTAIAVSISLVHPHLFYILLLYALVIGISRIYIGVHYPTDILVGLFVGTLFSYLSYLFLSGFLGY